MSDGCGGHAVSPSGVTEEDNEDIQTKSAAPMHRLRHCLGKRAVGWASIFPPPLASANCRGRFGRPPWPPKVLLSLWREPDSGTPITTTLPACFCCCSRLSSLIGKKECVCTCARALKHMLCTHKLTSPKRRARERERKKEKERREEEEAFSRVLAASRPEEVSAEAGHLLNNSRLSTLLSVTAHVTSLPQWR